MATDANVASRRQAQIFIEPGKGDRTVRVSYPGELTKEDVSRIDEVLVCDVVPTLGNCPTCLSGYVKVGWDLPYEKVINVQLD